MAEKTIKETNRRVEFPRLETASKRSTFSGIRYFLNVLKDTLSDIYTKILDVETNTTPPYKVYTALLSQSGQDAPTVIVFENTLGGPIIWSYAETGIYLGTLNDAFVLDKTVVFCGNRAGIDLNIIIFGSRDGNNAVVVQTGVFNNGSQVPYDEILNVTPIEIRVYN